MAFVEFCKRIQRSPSQSWYHLLTIIGIYHGTCARPAQVIDIRPVKVRHPRHSVPSSSGTASADRDLQLFDGLRRSALQDWQYLGLMQARTSHACFPSFRGTNAMNPCARPPTAASTIDSSSGRHPDGKRRAMVYGRSLVDFGRSEMGLPPYTTERYVTSLGTRSSVDSHYDLLALLAMLIRTPKLISIAIDSDIMKFGRRLPWSGPCHCHGIPPMT